MSAAYAIFDPFAPPLPEYADCELTLDDDIGIHPQCTVLYDNSPRGLTLQGTAWTYDAHADKWLVELQTGAGSRVEWCAADRLVMTMTAECANWARNGGW